MSLDQRARIATHDLLDRTTPDTARLLGELHRTHRRRGAGRVLVAAAVVAAAVGVGVRLGDDGAPEPAGPPEVRNGAFLVQRDTGPGPGTFESLGGDVAHVPEDAAPGWPAQFHGDGSSIVYVDRRQMLRSLDVATGTTRAIAPCPEDALCWPALSPDGRTLAYGGNDRVQLQDVAGGSPRPLDLPGVGRTFTPTWSPDGATLAFTTELGLWTVAATGGEPTLLVEHADTAGPLVGPSWSPDSSELAFIRRTGVKSSRTTFSAVVAAADGSGVRELGPAGACACLGQPPPQVAWSPDGSRIAVTTVSRAPVGTGIYVVPAEGGEWFAHHGGYFSSIAWQPVTE